LNLEQVEFLYHLCVESLLQKNIYKHIHGRTSSNVSVHNQLVLTLYWLRRYPAYHDIEIQYNIPISTFFLMSDEVLKLLDSLLVPRVILPLSAIDPHSSHEQYHNVYMVIDSTCIPIPRPVTDVERRQMYHPKSHTKFGLKVEITCSITNTIINVSEVVPGSTADIALVRSSGVLQQLNSNQLAIGDIGYIGDSRIIVPLKRSSKKRQQENLTPNITRCKKQKRKELQQQRSVIENINQRLKLWKIIDGQYRGSRLDLSRISMIARVVCALCNMNMSEHPIRKQ
jgi:DDE superfamily endonuclease